MKKQILLAAFAAVCSTGLLAADGVSGIVAPQPVAIQPTQPFEPQAAVPMNSGAKKKIVKKAHAKKHAGKAVPKRKKAAR